MQSREENENLLYADYYYYNHYYTYHQDIQTLTEYPPSPPTSIEDSPKKEKMYQSEGELTIQEDED